MLLTPLQNKNISNNTHERGMFCKKICFFEKFIRLWPFYSIFVTDDKLCYETCNVVDKQRIVQSSPKMSFSSILSHGCCEKVEKITPYVYYPHAR
jgi:hypothetical protein